MFENWHVIHQVHLITLYSPTQGILKEFYISLFFSRNIYCVIQNTSAQ